MSHSLCFGPLPRIFSTDRRQILLGDVLQVDDYLPQALDLLGVHLVPEVHRVADLLDARLEVVDDAAQHLPEDLAGDWLPRLGVGHGPVNTTVAAPLRVGQGRYADDSAAVLDSNVVVGARLKRDQWHDPGRAIVSGIDSGELPRGRLTNYHLPEILNSIEARAGDAPARRTLEFVTESRGLDVEQTTRDDYTRGLALYRREANVEVVDCIVVAHMRRTGLEYVYSFDDDFDRFDGITRLATPTDPFDAG